MFYQPGVAGHGLAHNPFKALIAPRPIGWISTLDTAGHANLAPFSFFNAIADEPSTDGVGVGVDSDIATEPAPAQRGDTATWHCVSIDGEPRNWITRPVLADMDELSIIVEEG